MLYKAFPALTLPMGANKNNADNMRGKNFDMPALYKTDPAKWPGGLRAEPVNGIEGKSWWHSDYKDIAYQHVYKFYNKIVNLTEN